MSNNIKNILIPTDFSKCAGNAMNFALELASRTGASVRVVHVVYPNEGVDNNVYSAIWIDDYFKQRKEDLGRWINRFKRNAAFKDIPITYDCEIGFPARTVKQIVAESEIDLVVMGTTGISGMTSTLLGSTAAGVVSSVEIPVMVIPTKADFLGHADYVLATDYEMHPNKHSVQVLKEILRVQHAGLHILHVLNKPEEEPNKTKEKAFEHHLEGLAYQFHYLHDASITQAINNYIEATQANGLVTISHHRTFLQKIFFQSKSKLLVQKIKVPILVLHDKE